MQPGAPLRDALHEASRSSADATEAVARGALAAGRRVRDVLAWAGTGDGAPHAAAVTAVLRDHGYEPVLRWAAQGGDDVVHTIPAPPGIDPDLFAVPRRVAVFGEALRRLYATDHPDVAHLLNPIAALSEQQLYRPEAIPALTREEGLLAALSEADHDAFEQVILPLSRVPGLNVLILAALIFQELVDPMEILSWVGADINALPAPARRTAPSR